MKKISIFITLTMIASLTVLAGCQWCCSCSKSNKKEQSLAKNTTQESIKSAPEHEESAKEPIKVAPKIMIEPKIIRT